MSDGPEILNDEDAGDAPGSPERRRTASPLSPLVQESPTNHAATRGPVKRSVTIAGHQTSVSLEPAFWAALEEAARELGLPLSALVARIDAERITAPMPPNLASAIRLWLFARARSLISPAEPEGSQS